MLNFISYAVSKHELGKLKDAGVQEVILTHSELSRIHVSEEKLDDIFTEARELGFKVFLEWDILCTENDFEKMVREYNKIKSLPFDAIRVQDYGVLEYCLENDDKMIQFITETGNHNIAGLKKWESYIGKRLDRMILSIELSKNKLTEIKKELNCPLEVLGVGRVLLFYSPRKLLSALLPEDDSSKKKIMVSDHFLEAIGESEESPHKGFPIVENKHGTFMFHIKDLFLLDKANELESTGIDFVRVDFRHKNNVELLQLLSKSEDQYSELKLAYGKDTIRGYFNINKSDVLFKKLKNHRIQRKDENYIGEVVEILKGEYLAIDIKGTSSIKENEEIKFITPEGKELFCKVYFLKDSEFQDCKTRSKGQLALMNYFGGVWPKSQVYHN